MSYDPDAITSISATSGIIGPGGTATVTFGASFVAEPTLMVIEIPGTTPAQTQPAVFRVESWVMTGPYYTGAVIKAWRSRVLPSLTSISDNIDAMISGVNAIATAQTAYSVMGASAVGTAFSCLALLP